MQTIIPKRAFWAIFVILFASALFIRCTHITIRPFHNDEGVNFFFIQGISQKGYYEYSHENYHGPAYFYITKAFTNLLGEDEFGMRASAIVVGTLTLVLILPFVSLSESLFVLIATFLMAFSPSLVFFSRYAIHETLFVFCGVALALSIFWWCQSRKVIHIYMAALSLALLICTKETFVITLFALGLATLTQGRFRESWTELKNQKNHLMYALLLIVLLVIGIYTGGFKWINGIRELFLAVPQWVGRNKSDVGHFKPFIYYAKVIWQTEPHLIMITLGSLVYSLVEIKNIIKDDQYRFVRFLFVWAATAFLVYSFLNYKTVWLIINITLPLILLSAFWLSRLIMDGKPLGIVVSLATAGLTLLNVWTYNFEKPYGPPNPFSYVHTSPGMLELVSDIDAYWQKNPAARVLVGVDGYWPLPFYLRSKPAQLAYLKTTKPEDYAKEYQIIISEKEATWDPPDWSKKYYRLSEVEETYTYFKRN